MIKAFKRKHIERTYRAPWYDTVRWRNERLSFIQDNPLCVECKAMNIIKPSVVVDHINNVSSYNEQDRESAFWNRNNWQALCKHHHDSKSGKERHK